MIVLIAVLAFGVVVLNAKWWVFDDAQRSERELMRKVVRARPARFSGAPCSQFVGALASIARAAYAGDKSSSRCYIFLMKACARSLMR
jgi:hypothetical protein